MARALSAQDLFGLRLGGAVQALADGRVLYLESSLDRKDNTAHSRVMALVPGRRPVAFTRGPHDSAPRVSPDGRWLAFLAGGDGPSQLWVMPTGGGEGHQVSDLLGGVRSFAWSPDSRSFALVTLVEGGRLQSASTKPRTDQERHTAGVRLASHAFYKLDGEGLFGPGKTEIVHQPLVGSPRLLTGLGARIGRVAFSADGRSLWFIRQSLDLPDVDWSELWQLELNSAAAPRHVAGDSVWSVDDVIPDPLQDRLLVIASDPAKLGYGNDQLYLLGPGQDRLRLLSDLDRPIGDLSACDLVPPGGPSVIWPQGQAMPYALVSTEGRVDVIEVPLDGTAGKTLTRGDHAVHAMAVHPEGLVVARSTAQEPSEIVMLRQGRERVLHRLNTAFLRRHPPQAPVRFSAAAAGGPSVDAWVILPKDPVGQRIPAVLSIHGGPMMMYGRTYTFEFQLLAALGIAVIACNPRGSQGYGEAFCSAISEEWGARDQADLMAACDQALASFPLIDPRRLGVSGGSYGGFMTTWLIGHSRRFSAAHAARSVTDWRQMAGSSDMFWYWHRRLGGHPWQDQAGWVQQSPLSYVDQVQTPVLIEHQEGDLRCPIGQGESYFTALKALGRVAVFVRYPGEFHGMTRDGKPWHRVHRLALLSDWWRHFLLGEPASSALAPHLGTASVGERVS